MLFNSFAFIFVFLPPVLAVRYLVGRWKGARWAQGVLLLASCVFYAWAKPQHIPFLVGSVLFNFAVARAVGGDRDQKLRRRWLWVGIVANVLFLGTVKYSRFVVSIVSTLTRASLPKPDVWFPLGVSFYTLTQVMYLVDCYEGLSQPHGLFDHLSFVACFPYLVSGPLVRARHMVSQLRESRGPSAEAFGRGLFLFGVGLFKKAVIADSIRKVVDIGFKHVGKVSAAEAWIACIIYCLQMYFDFSGYSDMAVGTGQMLGLRIPINFKVPYRSTSVPEFWLRWHITLSQFITTYLYTPIVRARRKVTLARAAFAIFVAMTIAGLWHGPAWTYVLWGTIHGVALAVTQVWRKKIKIKLPAALGWALTMQVVLFSLVFFRAPDLATGWGMCRALFGQHGALGISTLEGGLSTADLRILAVPAVLAVPLSLLGPDSNDLADRLSPGWKTALAVAGLYGVSFLFLNSSLPQDFLYFAF